MNVVLIKKVQIISPEYNSSSSPLDVLIKNGIIEKIGQNINVDADTIFEEEGLSLSIGWTDIGVQVCDPGYEHREDLHTVSMAAAAGGFTTIACQPNTNPCIHSKSEVQYVQRNTGDAIVDILPIGAVSENCAGKDITEMYDMHKAGAIAFSDGDQPIQDSGLMMRALQYVKTINGIIINQPFNSSIAQNGQMNEGFMSTTLGMRGIPHIAEDLMVQRDIYLAEYTASRLHLSNVSTTEAVRLIRIAKQKGIKVTASVPIINLILTDSVLERFETNYKVSPPLRHQEDIDALLKGLSDGTIDFINSNHTPLDEEDKKKEFTYAKFGVIGLQTTFPLLNTYLKQFQLKEVINFLAYQPRKIFGIDIPKIVEGEIANLTLFNPKIEWTMQRENIQSKSKNTPFIGKRFKGKIKAVFNKKQSIFF